MNSSLKMMPTTLQVILGKFLLFSSIFGPKLKFLKNEKCRTKNTENHKHTKITIISHVVPQIECGQAFCQFWAQIKIFKKMEKRNTQICNHFTYS